MHAICTGILYCFVIRVVTMAVIMTHNPYSRGMRMRAPPAVPAVGRRSVTTDRDRATTRARARARIRARDPGPRARDDGRRARPFESLAQVVLPLYAPSRTS